MIRPGATFNFYKFTMADDGKLDKLKEQYVDEILAIVPLSQAFFIVLMVLVADRIWDGKSWSVLEALGALGLKSGLGPDDGQFWKVGILSICISFALALFNTYLLRDMLERSLRRAKLGSALVRWQQAASVRIAGLSEAQRNTIQISFKNEIDARFRKYKAKRISIEVVASLAAMTVYANILIIFVAHKKSQALQWDLWNAMFLFGSVVICFILHRASIRYAISKLLPLKVYVGVLTGELIFFEELSR